MSEARWMITRRDLMRTGSAWALASLFGCRQTETAEPGVRSVELRRAPRSRVVLVRARDVVKGDGTPDAPTLGRMLDDAVVALTETSDARAAWRSLVRPGDVVGIKSNSWRMLATPAALEDAVRDRVLRIGLGTDAVSVDDRGVRGNPVFKRATALINVRPMRTHHWSGLGTCLKNYIMFAPRPSDYHGDACASLGAVWRLPAVEGKTRLNVLVMLTPQFHGVGPHSFSPQFVWPYGGLIVGTDPVAVDATGARIIEAKRREHFRDDRAISPPPHHIQIADSRYGLGNSAPSAIDVVRLGWTEGALV